MTDSRDREALHTCTCGKRAYTSRAVARRAARIQYPAWSIRAFWAVILAGAAVTVLVRRRLGRVERLVRAEMRGLDAELEKELTA